METQVAEVEFEIPVSEDERAEALAILQKCRAGELHPQDDEVLEAVAIVGILEAIEIVTGAPLESEVHAAIVADSEHAQFLLREKGKLH